jgi:hypothetical protein
MATWVCGKCNSQNRAEGNFCTSCGAPRRAAPAPAPSAPAPAASVQSASAHARGVLDKILEGRGSSFSQSRASLEHFSAEIGKISVPNLDQMLKPTKVTTRDLKLKHNAHPFLNYALAHCGLPLIPALEIINNSHDPAQDVLVKAWVATDYGEPWQKSIPSIVPGQAHVEKSIFIPLRKERLQQVREAERANLRIDVYTAGELQLSETYPTDVLAYNEWYYSSHFPQTVASFVQPNSPAVESIISAVRDRLKREKRDTSLDGYQSGDPAKLLEMLEAFFYVLQQDLQISYINPPASFEGGGRLPDGSITVSQKVFFPEQILQHRRGTCMDLALLCAACVERMGMYPIWFMIHGHAFFGVWLYEKSLPEPVVTNHEVVAKLVSEAIWLPLNSTTFAVTPPKEFKNCIEEAAYCLSDPERFICAVDVQAARLAGIKPVPPMMG